MNFIEAHEAWEDLWSDYNLDDKKFIQGLIQLSVSFVHLENNNLNGARSLLKKCNEKNLKIIVVFIEELMLICC